MKKLVLIFGISGFVGSYLAAEFHNNGYDVCGTDIQFNANMPDYVDFESCDLLDSEAVKNLIKKIKPTHIVNLAAISSVGISWQIPQKTISINVEGSLNILEAVKTIDRTVKVLFVGSSEEYAISDKPIDEKGELNANNPYGISKVMQERFAEMYRERYGMRIYCVRPFNHTGVGQSDSFVLPSWCKQAAEITKSENEGVIRVGNIDICRDFSDVKDIVKAYRMIIERSDCKKVYNVGSGEAVSLHVILEYIASLSSQKITVQVDEQLFRPSDNIYICADNSAIKEELGWNPRYNVFETIKDMYNYYLSKN